MTATATRKPRLRYRGQVYALIEQYGATIGLDDEKAGLHGVVTAPDGRLFAETESHTLELAFDGKREIAWPVVLRTLKKGLSDCYCGDCVPTAAPAGLEFAPESVTAALLADLAASMGARQVAAGKRTQRAHGPHGLTAEYRTAYHAGWAAAGKATARQSDFAGEHAGFLAAFADRRAGNEPWASARS